MMLFPRVPFRFDNPSTAFRSSAARNSDIDGNRRVEVNDKVARVTAIVPWNVTNNIVVDDQVLKTQIDVYSKSQVHE